MVVDTHKFTPGAKSLQPDTLLVVEEMPGHISAIDRTPVLAAQGFWSSYNVASDPFIYNISDSWADGEWRGLWEGYVISFHTFCTPAFAAVWKYGGPEGPGAFEGCIRVPAVISRIAPAFLFCLPQARTTRTATRRATTSLLVTLLASLTRQACSASSGTMTLRTTRSLARWAAASPALQRPHTTGTCHRSCPSLAAGLWLKPPLRADELDRGPLGPRAGARRECGRGTASACAPRSLSRDCCRREATTLCRTSSTGTRQASTPSTLPRAGWLRRT